MISIGIDISKGKSTVCFLKPYGELVKSPFEITHTEGSLTYLSTLIKSLSEDEVKIVMESTGSYHLPILTFLKSQGFFVSVINPLLMKKYTCLTLRKGKTDTLDSVKIANYGLDNWFKLKDYQVSDDIYSELKILNSQYLSYMQLHINASQNLTLLLDRTMPGIKELLRNRPDSPDHDKLCSFAKKYWHFDCITKKPEQVFIAEYNNWAKKEGYRASELKASQIYALALEGIPTLSSTTPSTKMLVVEAVKTMFCIDKTLVCILARMQELAKSLKEYETVRSMPGVGDVLAPRLIAEIGDVRRFYNASALIAYAGLDAPPFQSGSFEAQKRRISKRGSASLRLTGYQVMRCLKQIKPTEDNAVYLFILKKEAEGKPKKVAKIAGLNKFLRIYYARVKEAYSI